MSWALPREWCQSQIQPGSFLVRPVPGPPGLRGALPLGGLGYPTRTVSGDCWPLLSPRAAGGRESCSGRAGCQDGRGRVCPPRAVLPCPPHPLQGPAAEDLFPPPELGFELRFPSSALKMPCFSDRPVPARCPVRANDCSSDTRRLKYC